MNTTMNNGKGNDNRNMVKTIFRKLAILKDEAVWHFALVGLVVTAIVDGALSVSGGSIV